VCICGQTWGEGISRVKKAVRVGRRGAIKEPRQGYEIKVGEYLVKPSQPKEQSENGETWIKQEIISSERETTRNENSAT